MSTPLVAIGTSLGGLDALTRVLGPLPPTTRAAFVLVQHRMADSDSRLARLLASRCRLAVREAQDKIPIEADTITIAPADYHLLVEGDHFALSTDEPVCYARPSIDVLFESAAQDRTERTLIAVLLTAASEDGARGMAAVARAGGITIVQDPEEAESGVAPRAALALTRVDHVLGLDDIGPKLMDLLSVTGSAPSPANDTPRRRG